jgi:hypothetical protein
MIKVDVLVFDGVAHPFNFDGTSSETRASCFANICMPYTTS